MKGSKDNPIYTVYVVDGSTKYDITSCMESIRFTERKAQFAKNAQFDIMNTKTNGTWLSSVLKTRVRMFVYADDGEESGEVWRGFIWSSAYKSSMNDRLIYINCYDNLIYMQESEEAEYISGGKTTKDAVTNMFNNWGVDLEYTYESIELPKIAARGKLSDILINDLLESTKERTGEEYVILSEKDVVKIRGVGQNLKIYKIHAGNNAIQTSRSSTMEGMVTKIVIQGKADEEDRRPVEAVVSRNTGKYGTLQKIITRNESTTLEEAKQEANTILDEYCSPTREFEVVTTDIPWIRKGDMVEVKAGEFDGLYRVVGVDREINNKAKTMTLTIER